MKRLVLLLYFIAVLSTIAGEVTMLKNNHIKENANLKLTVVYDNNPFADGLQTDWGFSCLVEFGETKLLFDTGDNGTILMNNMEKLGIDPKSIDILFLSHFHHDHTGGMNEFLKQNSKVKVYYPQSFPKQIVDEVKKAGADPIPVSSFEEILPGIFTLGEFSGIIPEQALAIKSRKGIVIITGCAHPGILRIMEKGKEIFPDESLYLTIGGFHLHATEEVSISKIADQLMELGVQKAGPCHCSGSNTLDIFKKKFGINYEEIGVGKNIYIY